MKKISDKIDGYEHNRLDTMRRQLRLDGFLDEASFYDGKYEIAQAAHNAVCDLGRKHDAVRKTTYIASGTELANWLLNQGWEPPTALRPFVEDK